MRIITSGAPYIDVDAYAGCIAYAELLRLLGKDAKAISTSRINESVTDKIKSWEVDFSDRHKLNELDTFTLIDVSSPEHFDEIVELDKVDEVIDHHPGFEEYWKQKIGKNTQIEFIGSACTFIYERWQAAGLVDKMSETSARLLICGILDNTLNFNATVNTPRDEAAYNQLLRIANLPADWTEVYFSDCANAIFSNFSSALLDDTKLLSFETFQEDIAVGQIVVWDGSSAISEYSNEITQVLASKKPHWFINIVSVSEGKSHFYSSNEQVKNWLEKLLDIQFDKSTATASRLWLRKEILKQDIEASR